MPLPVPNLDDRRFEDLVAEAKARLGNHLPELTQIAPGDPVHSFIDLFAWLTETILYRANLIPERQRRIFLNLLQIPLRPARAAHGITCIDATPTNAALPPPVRDGAQLKAGKQSLTVVGELQPTCLELQIAVKEKMSSEALKEMGLTLQDLAEQFGLRKGETPTPFEPRRLEPGKETLSLTGTLDNAYYLACITPEQLKNDVAAVRENLAGITLNIALAPADNLESDLVKDLKPATLVWELATTDEADNPIYLPLEVLADSSNGGRQSGVARLRLPKNSDMFKSFAPTDPMFSGVGGQPPELADEVAAERVALWLRLSSPDHPQLKLGYLGINGVDVLAQGLKQNRIVGSGDGRPDQVLTIGERDIDGATLQLDVEENGNWSRWQQVAFLAGQDSDAKVYTLDPQNGYITFGDGVSAGRRPGRGAKIRAAAYLHGGGVEGNLNKGAIKEIVDGNPRHKLRHEWPLSGGLAAETVEQAEKRIPQFLTHRNRAVTKEDFKLISEANPVNPVARAEVRVGFLPGARIEAARENVPGAVSVFVLPPAAAPALGHTPKPTQGLLKDVFGYLLDRVLIGTELYVLSPEYVPLAVSVQVKVRDAETEQQTLKAVRYALIDYLWPLAPGGGQADGWPMGGSVYPNELLAEAARVDGVRAITRLSLFIRTKRGWRRLRGNQELELKHYQLPELVGIRVESDAEAGRPQLPDGLGGKGGGDPRLPDGIGHMEGETPEESREVPVPVIPDVC